MQLVATANAYLQTQGMTVTTEWLEGCVEFFCEETNNRNIDAKELCDMVKSQWMLADLQEISPGCLPPDLKNQIKTTLNGSFALQMNCIIDIGVPAYQQLQKLQKVDTSNIEVTNTNFSDPPLQRMLKLILTDGVQEISGIEYKPMRNLNSNLIPGVKIQVKGPIDCRRGVLMLEEKHVTILGGEVDDLLEKNNYKNVLKRKVGHCDGSDEFPTTDFTRDIIINNLPNTHNTESSSYRSTISNANVKPNKTAQIQPNVYKEDLDLNADMFEDEMFDMDQLEAIEKQIIKKENSSNVTTNAFDAPSTSYANNINKYDEKPLMQQFNDDPMSDDELADFEEYFREPKIPKIEPRTEEFENKPFVTENVSIKYPIKVNRDPFIYIRQLSDCSKSNNEIFIVKAQILKVVGKLSFQNRDWVLKCTIVDGSGCLDVNIAGELLSVIIGYSPEEMVKVKKRISSEPNLKTVVMEKLDRAMNYMQKLDGLFHITYRRGDPYVIKTSDVMQTHLNQLQQRLAKVV